MRWRKLIHCRELPWNMAARWDFFFSLTLCFPDGPIIIPFFLASPDRTDSSSQPPLCLGQPIPAAVLNGACGQEFPICTQRWTPSLPATPESHFFRRQLLFRSQCKHHTIPGSHAPLAGRGESTECRWVPGKNRQHHCRVPEIRQKVPK